MTILDCIKDQFYGEEKARDLIDDLIKIINHDILSLANHGCKDIHLDVCAHCHPFYTGKQKTLDAGGRVDKFNKRFGNRSTKK